MASQDPFYLEAIPLHRGHIPRHLVYLLRNSIWVSGHTEVKGIHFQDMAVWVNVINYLEMRIRIGYNFWGQSNNAFVKLDPVPVRCSLNNANILDIPEIFFLSKSQQCRLVSLSPMGSQRYRSRVSFFEREPSEPRHVIRFSAADNVWGPVLILNLTLSPPMWHSSPVYRFMQI